MGYYVSKRESFISSPLPHQASIELLSPFPHKDIKVVRMSVSSSSLPPVHKWDTAYQHPCFHILSAFGYLDIQGHPGIKNEYCIILVTMLSKWDTTYRGESLSSHPRCHTLWTSDSSLPTLDYSLSFTTLSNIKYTITVNKQIYEIINTFFICHVM